MQSRFAALQVLMHLHVSESIVVQVVEAGVAEIFVRAAQHRQIEGVVLSVVEAGEKKCSSRPLWPAVGFCEMAASISFTSQILGARLDQFLLVLERLEARPSAGSDLHHRLVEFGALVLPDLGLHVNHLRWLGR